MKGPQPIVPKYRGPIVPPRTPAPFIPLKVTPKMKEVIAKAMAYYELGKK